MNDTQTLQTVPKPETFGSTQQFEHTQRVALMLAKSDLIPSSFKGNVQNVMIALELAARIGASPLAVMQNLYVVHGKPSWSSQFAISAINTSKKFEPLRYEMNGKQGTEERGCIAWTIDKGVDLPEKVRTIAEAKDAGVFVYESPEVTMKMAKLEGWVDKNGSKWKTMPELMLRYRAATFFGRLYTPEIMMGMQTHEEVIDIAHEVQQPEEVRRMKEYERVNLMIQDATSAEELESLVEYVAEDQMPAWKNKMAEINGKV